MSSANVSGPKVDRQSVPPARQHPTQNHSRAHRINKPLHGCITDDEIKRPYPPEFRQHSFDVATTEINPFVAWAYRRLQQHLARYVNGDK